jgi:hypothetical protein
MLELADIVRRYGAAYRACAGARLLPSHARALHDIERCRTAALGGHLQQCDQCGQRLYSYHSCGNRACPKCHGAQTERWLAHSRARLLPCRYFLLTFTLPAALRALARSHQKVLYPALMRCAAAAVQKLAADPRYLGARLGALAVLHTWTRALDYHPHVHLLVTAGGWSAPTQQWIDARHPAYLLPVRALSVIFRAKMCAALAHAGLLAQTPRALWKADWVVHSQSAGSGDKVLQYLARYVFRIAISNSRLQRLDNGVVTFGYRDGRTQRRRRVQLPALQFLARFLQHVLPRGLAKVRYYGIFSSTARTALAHARASLVNRNAASPSRCRDPIIEPTGGAAGAATPAPRCPYCHRGRLFIVERLHAQPRAPP